MPPNDPPPAWVDDLLAGAPPLVEEGAALELLRAALARRRKIVLFPRCDLAAVLAAIGGGADDAQGARSA